mmetsp:Transcript_27579/g.56584  ORF Transcript_27579/g.56584 Transcript_27579/m.56584 type:complete len:267 (-) Transcript_27579:725-1525(-)
MQTTASLLLLSCWRRRSLLSVLSWALAAKNTSQAHTLPGLLPAFRGSQEGWVGGPSKVPFQQRQTSLVRRSCLASLVRFFSTPPPTPTPPRLGLTRAGEERGWPLTESPPGGPTTPLPCRPSQSPASSTGCRRAKRRARSTGRHSQSRSSTAPTRKPPPPPTPPTRPRCHSLVQHQPCRRCHSHSLVQHSRRLRPWRPLWQLLALSKPALPPPLPPLLLPRRRTLKRRPQTRPHLRPPPRGHTSALGNRTLPRETKTRGHHHRRRS